MKINSACVLCSVMFIGGFLNAQTPIEILSTNATQLTLESEPKSVIWKTRIGKGFSSDAQSISIGAGANYGMATFGSREAHDLALINLTYGHMVGDVAGEGHWYRGNAELRLELFTGAEFSPSRDWLVGLTPHFRYNFATGTRWIPYIDVGTGVTATGIGAPDLNGILEFNHQAGGGIMWFFNEHTSVTLDVHYVHWSCGGLNKPNHGLNGITGMLGVAFFF